MMTRLHSLFAETKGSTVVEMGLAAPFLATLLIGMVDVSRAYSSKLQLEQASQRTIEMVMQQKNVASDYNAVLKAEGAAAAGVAESAVTPDFWLECDGVRQSDWNGSCAAGQVYARYVRVEIAKGFKPLFSSKYFPGASTDGTYTLRGRAGIRVQ